MHTYIPSYIHTQTVQCIKCNTHIHHGAFIAFCIGLRGVGVVIGGVVVPDMVGRVAVGTGVVGGSVGIAVLERIVP